MKKYLFFNTQKTSLSDDKKAYRNCRFISLVGLLFIAYDHTHVVFISIVNILDFWINKYIISFGIEIVN